MGTKYQFIINLKYQKVNLFGILIKYVSNNIINKKTDSIVYVE